MARIIAIGGIKGGSGKTTLAVNLAIMESQKIAIRPRGEMPRRKVLLVDADAQDTASDFSAFRKALHPKTIMYDYIKLLDFAVKTDVLAKRNIYDTIIIDTGGGDTSSQRLAISMANVFLVPFVPSAFDVWTINKLDALVSEAKMINPGLQAYSFLNRVDHRGKEAGDAALVLQEFTNLEYLDMPIGARKTFSRSVQQGLSVMEYPGSTSQAKAEIWMLHEFVEAR